MNYQAEFKPKAIEDLESLPAEVQSRVLTKIELMPNNLTNDVLAHLSTLYYGFLKKPVLGRHHAYSTRIITDI